MVCVSCPEYNLALKRLSFHDMNLADCQSEVLFLLQNLTLQGKFLIQNLDIFILIVVLLLSHEVSKPVFFSSPCILNYKKYMEPVLTSFWKSQNQVLLYKH